MSSSLAAEILLALSGISALTLGQTSTPSSGIDLKAIDKAANPCQDFYTYACGTWMKANPIPAQYAIWGRFNELQDRNLEVLHQIAEDSARNQQRSALDQEIGGFYASCMDEGAVEKAGASPIKPEIDRIRAIKDKSELPAEVARLHEQAVVVLFNFGPNPDPDEAKLNIATIDQGGLGLPEKGFYTRTGKKDEETRAKYVQHVSRMLQLLGESQSDASMKAKAIMTLETSLAKASLDNVQRRNPHLMVHKTPASEFEAANRNFEFKQYFGDIAAPAFKTINVRVPEFFSALNAALDSTSLEDFKSYFVWHYVSSYAPELSSAFVNENFDFYQRYLTGAKEIQPRWKRCVQLTDRELGEALGQKYVEKAFSPDAKKKTLELVGTIEKQMAIDINSLSWMSEVTKQQALAKLKGVTNKIGYPGKWRDYSSVKIVDGDLVGDVRRAREFEVRRQLNKIGKPVERSEFGMTPPTVNAYYRAAENNINFPAGILQPPFYTNSADMAVNFGAIGAVIGHELTHGFDDQGRQYDADGNLRDWWTKQDEQEFKKRADCFVNEYSKFSPVAGANVNGRLTLGENGADNGGIRLAYMALLGGIENGSVDKNKLDGYTPEQRFFLGYAQIWCQNGRDAAFRLSTQTNPHSPGRFRVDGVVQNVPEFATAFGCSAGEPMVAANNGCRVW